ncbi:hypothetical protein B0J18DRAFT_132015 [Chaetomium sp. MPI-SDFR-AT-0129]|nr:hypothetical protein B0J18DRAFT_132015 [Chaetomium sp. MPI-SDFR-AT-0129]
MAAAEPPPARMAQALVDFSLYGSFPEDTVSSLPIDAESLPAAIKALADAKAKLQAEIHAINEETAEDVKTWQANAQLVQDDILRSKALAAEIVKAAEAPVVSGQAVDEIEARADFLIRELNYNAQVQETLRGIRTVNRTLDEVEQARDERRILDALHLLEKSWKQLDIVGVKSCRAIKLLDVRAFELKSDVHEVFDHVWNALIHVDVDGHKVSIQSSREDEPMNLEDAVIGLRAYKEVDQRMDHLWKNLSQAILLPRMDLAKAALPGIRVEDGVLALRGSADNSIHSLFEDLDQVFSYLVQRLPPDLIDTISSSLLPDTIHRITSVWLDSAVPSSLHDMDGFQVVIEAAKTFCARLRALGFSNFGGLQEWTDNAPKVWLSKCREAALDSVRTKLSQGLGAPRQVEKVEKQMVSKTEGQQLVANAAVATADDHGWDAWDDGEQAGQEETPNGGADEPPGDEDDGTDAWGWGEEGGGEEEAAAEEPKKETKATAPQPSKPDDDDDPSEAWGWGDEANTDNTDEANTKEPEPQKAPPVAPRAEPETRELILKETYSISSLPQPLLDLIFSIVQDGAALTKESYAGSPVATQAAGLFSLPTLALAVFRAVSPHYYAPGIGGNMYLYNDSGYLAEQLGEFAAAWKTREDISARAQNMLRLDNDVKTLQSFANRAYTNELAIQKTVLRDLLGGEQNLLHQPDTAASISSATARVLSLGTAWEDILARSVWQQAVGSLVDAVAAKMIADVMDLPSIGQDEAYNIAKLIASVEELDQLFLPSRGQPQDLDSGGKKPEGDEVPMTAQFAGNWLRLKYLSEVLQSNLRDVRFLWVEGELSLYFTAEEVVDLIQASFEDNARTREVIRDVRANVRPLGGDGDEGGGW